MSADDQPSNRHRHDFAVYALMVERLRTQGIQDERVLAVFAEVQRHIFVDEALGVLRIRGHRPADRFGMIPQPWVVARTVDLLAAAGLNTVLEIGTGCVTRPPCYRGWCAMYTPWSAFRSCSCANGTGRTRDYQRVL